MNPMNKTVCTITAAMLAFGCSACSEENNSESMVDAPLPETNIMVTLGDSIAAGYGLDEAETQRYSALLTEQLGSETVLWEDYNYAVSGDTATQMLKRLENGRAVRLPSADVITISIGANHMLQPFVTFYGQWLSAGMEASPALNDAFAEMEAAINAGLQEFEEQLPLIYDHIRDRNANAQLIFLSIYNPFADVDAEIALTDKTVDLSDYAEEQIGRCNAVIKEFAVGHADVTVADIYTAFAEEPTVPIIGQVSDQQKYYVDPHPDGRGHQIIADVIGDILQGDAD